MRATIDLGHRLLLHNKLRLLSMSLSVAVGVIIIFVEMGLLVGVLDSQALVATLASGDFLVMSKSRVDLHRWDKIQTIELAQIGAIPGVAKVMPVYEDHVGFMDPDDNRVRRIIVYAFSPDDMPLAIGDRAMIAAELRMSKSFLFDRLSRPIFGNIKPGMNIDIDKFPLEVAGTVEMGPDIVNDGNIFMSEGEWLARSPNAQPIMGVVRLAPGSDPDTMRQRILSRLPPDVAVLTPAEAHERENEATLRSAPIGILFTIGMLAGLVIGTINCYQVLYTEVSDHLAQYATVKAMGFSDRFLHGVILTQAALLAGAGFAVGLVLSAAIDTYIGWVTKLPIQIQPLSGALVCVATFAMCALAGWIAIRRVEAADPAALF